MHPGLGWRACGQQIELGRRDSLDCRQLARERARFVDAHERRFAFVTAMEFAVLGGAAESKTPVRQWTEVAPLVAVMVDARNDARILRDGEEPRRKRLIVFAGGTDFRLTFHAAALMQETGTAVAS